MRDSFWKNIAIALATCFVTGFSSWLTFGLSRISQADMSAYVEKEIVKNDISKITAIEKLNTKMDMVLDEIKTIRASIKDGK